MECRKFLEAGGFPFPSSSGEISLPSLEAEFQLRTEFIARFGFAIPSHAALRTIAQFSPILEVGAGSGYWAYELSKIGADIVATDPRLTKYLLGGESHHPWREDGFFPVAQLIARKALRQYPDRTLLMVWPDMLPWPYQALRLYKGKTFLYVGEASGGCTGTDKFHDYLDRNFEQVARVTIPQFWGIRDFLSVWSRKD